MVCKKRRSEKTSNNGPYVIGRNYLIRTVTNYYTGKLLEVCDGELVLSEAAWVADTGRFSEALKTGSLKEVEPYPDLVIVSRGAIVDVSRWDHDLPRGVK